MAKKLGWQLDSMPEKMKAIATFHGQLLVEMQNNPKVYQSISNAAAKIVSKYFDAYVDHVAKIDSYRYHHIYEFGRVGSKDGRLFKSTVRNGSVSYSLIESSVPNQNGQVFARKAFVMESGERLVITPKNSSLLVYEIDGEKVFSKESIVQNPGGQYVKGAFASIFEEFFRSNLPANALKEFGFYDTIQKAMLAESNSVSKAINNKDFSDAAGKAARAAYGIAGRIEQDANRL